MRNTEIQLIGETATVLDHLHKRTLQLDGLLGILHNNDISEGSHKDCVIELASDLAFEIKGLVEIAIQEGGHGDD